MQEGQGSSIQGGNGPGSKGSESRKDKIQGGNNPGSKGSGSRKDKIQGGKNPGSSGSGSRKDKIQRGKDPEIRTQYREQIPTPALLQPSGVFSRLGDALDGTDPVDPVDPVDPEALPYAGVLKKRRECSGSSGAAAAPLACGEAQDGAVSSSVPWGCGRVSSSSSSSSSCGAGSVFRRLGRKPD